MTRKKTLLVTAVVALSLAILVVAVYGWTQVAFLKGYVAGSGRERASQLFFEAALFQEFKRASSESDFAKVRQDLERHLRLGWESFQVTATELVGVDQRVIANLNKLAGDALEAVPVGPEKSIRR